jgi:hypothetical protein
VLLGTIGGTYNARRLGQGDQKAEFATIVARLRSRGIKIIRVTGSGIGKKLFAGGRNSSHSRGSHLGCSPAAAICGPGAWPLVFCFDDATHVDQFSARSQAPISLAAMLACCSNLPMVKKP